MSRTTKTTNALLLEKSQAIDKEFSRLKAYLEGKSSKETDDIIELKRIIANYSIRHPDCYAQADNYFHVKKGRCLFYNEFSQKVQTWFCDLVGIFKQYEARMQTAPGSQLAMLSVPPTIKDNPRIRWYFDDCAEDRQDEELSDS